MMSAICADGCLTAGREVAPVAYGGPENRYVVSAAPMCELKPVGGERFWRRRPIKTGRSRCESIRSIRELDAGAGGRHPWI